MRPLIISRNLVANRNELYGRPSKQEEPYVSRTPTTNTRVLC